MTAHDLPQDPDSESGLSRRSLINRSAAGVGIVLSGSIPGLFGAGAAEAHGKRGTAGYGPLVPDPAGILSLPAGFTYTIVAQSGDHDARQR